MNANELLGDLDALRRKTRADRRGYAFPLFLFGALILLAPLTYRPAPPLPADIGPVTVEAGPFPQFTPLFGNVLHPGLIGWYWVLTIVGGMAATSWWYRRRAVRLGVETDTRIPFVATGAVLAGILLWQPVLDHFAMNGGSGSPLYSAPWLNLPILFGSAVLAAATLTWTSRPQRTDRQRASGVFAGVLLASLTFATISVYLIKGFSALLVIAVGLLVLAWWERSVLLTVVGTLFTVVSIPANHWLWDWDTDLFYAGLGWTPLWDDTRSFALQNLLAPGLILVVGGVVAAVTRRRSAP